MGAVSDARYKRAVSDARYIVRVRERKALAQSVCVDALTQTSRAHPRSQRSEAVQLALYHAAAVLGVSGGALVETLNKSIPTAVGLLGECAKCWLLLARSCRRWHCWGGAWFCERCCLGTAGRFSNEQALPWPAADTAALTSPHICSLATLCSHPLHRAPH